MTPREAQIREIERVKDALRRTRSEKLRKQYEIHLKRLQAELRIYDAYREGRRS